MNNNIQFLDGAFLDGALATELEARGADLNDPLWSAKLLLENPDLIRQVHYDYLLAGADIIITASYQASFEGFAQRGIGHQQAIDLMLLSVQLACEARAQFWAEPANRINRTWPLVAASIGPYGAYLADGSEYRGDYGLSPAELIDFHRPRMAVMVESDADLLACETIPCRAEGEALVALLAEFPETKAWLSFSCCDGLHVCHGETFADCVALVNAHPQIVAVGVNCTPPQFVASLITQARDVTDIPIVVYPNSGELWDSANHAWHQHSGTGTDDFCMMAQGWSNAGATIIGGCCRTNPDTIQALKMRVR
ncbi:MAG: homocysteine S-methyltransferase [Chloroflexota bacterium]